jgi:hypothetical protein
MMALRYALLVITVVAVLASNVYWQWADNYLAAAIAFAAGGLVASVFYKIVVRASRARMYRLYGKDWR